MSVLESVIGPKRRVTLRGIKTIRVFMICKEIIRSEEESYPKRD